MQHGFGAGTIHLSANQKDTTKIRLDPDTLAVQSFDTGGTEPLRGTVQAHQDLSEHCNTRQPFCRLPSVDIPCITDEVECG